MNHVETVRGDVAQLVREHVLEGIDDVLFGVTFDGRRLVVAGGDRLWRLVTDTGREVDELETSPSPGGLAYDGRHLWQRSADRLQQLELRTGFVVRSIPLKLDDVTGLECLGRDVLVLHAGGHSLARVETFDGTVVDQFEMSAPLRGLGRARVPRTRCAGPPCGRALARSRRDIRRDRGRPVRDERSAARSRLGPR